MLSKGDAICKGMLARIKGKNRDMLNHLDDVQRAIEQLGERGWPSNAVIIDIGLARDECNDANLLLKRLLDVIKQRFGDATK